MSCSGTPILKVFPCFRYWNLYIVDFAIPFIIGSHSHSVSTLLIHLCVIHPVFTLFIPSSRYSLRRCVTRFVLACCQYRKVRSTRGDFYSWGFLHVGFFTHWILLVGILLVGILLVGSLTLGFLFVGFCLSNVVNALFLQKNIFTCCLLNESLGSRPLDLFCVFHFLSRNSNIDGIL